MKPIRYAPVLLALVAGCKASEGYGGIGWFSRSIESDWESFKKDINGTPAFIRDHTQSQTRDLTEGIKTLASYTRDNMKTTSENISGAHAWAIGEAKRDIAGLSDTGKTLTLWTKENAKTTAENITGAPAYVHEQARRDIRDMRAAGDMLLHVERDNWNNFFSDMLKTLQVMFFE